VAIVLSCAAVLALPSSGWASLAGTQTQVSCSPSSVKVSVATTCTVTVANSVDGPATPGGDVHLVVAYAGSLPSLCTLASGSCSFDFTPSPPRSGCSCRIDAHYLGDTTHDTSTGTTYVSALNRTASASAGCAPVNLVLGETSTCSVTVTDVDEGQQGWPQGIGMWSSGGLGTFSTPNQNCFLRQNEGTPSTSCTIDYTPSALGAHAISVTYPFCVASPGDPLGCNNHMYDSASADAGTITVVGPPDSSGDVADEVQHSPVCIQLQAKLHRLKGKLARQRHGLDTAGSARKRSLIATNIKDTRARMVKLGC
jgi:hypothetical protein